MPYYSKCYTILRTSHDPNKVAVLLAMGQDKSGLVLLTRAGDG